MTDSVKLVILALFLSFVSYGAIKKFAYIDSSKCVKCGNCYKVCPVKAISKVTVKKDLFYVIDPTKCVACGACVKGCPVKAISFVEKDPLKTKSQLDSIYNIKVAMADTNKNTKETKNKKTNKDSIPKK